MVEGPGAGQELQSLVVPAALREVERQVVMGGHQQAEVGSRVELPDAILQMADGGLGIAGDSEQEAAGDHGPALELRIVAAAGDGGDPVEQPEGLAELLPSAQERRLVEQQMSFLQ